MSAVAEQIDLEEWEAGATSSAADVKLVTRKREFNRTTSEVVAGKGQIVVASSFTPHRGQRSLLKSGARFRTVFAGRRGGKTRGGAEEVVRHALGMDKAVIWVVAPTMKMLQEVPIKAILRDTVLGEPCGKKLANYRKTDGLLEFVNGSRVVFRSAEREDGLRGDGPNFVWADEIQMLRESAWKILEAATADQLGRMLGTGTPFGRNHWTYPLWARGQDPDFPDCGAWRFPSHLNPMVTRDELERARRANSKDWFAQEYMAEFVTSMVTALGEIDQAIISAVPGSESNLPCLLGLDLAQAHDFTVCTVMNSNGTVVFQDRRHKEAYSTIRERVLDIAARYNCNTLIGDASHERAVLESLEESGLNVVYFHTAASGNKNNLIAQLAVDMSDGRVKVPETEERLLYELRIYRKSMTSGGKPKYEAPSGEHDDCVIALALANWGVNKLQEIMSGGSLGIALGATAVEAVRARNSIWGRQGTAAKQQRDARTLWGR